MGFKEKLNREKKNISAFFGKIGKAFGKKSEDGNDRKNPVKSSEKVNERKKKKPFAVVGYTPKEWGKGLLFFLSSVWKVALKVLGVISNVILTVLLVFAVAGVIAGCVFAVYLGNNVDASIEEFEMLSSSQNQTTIIYCYDSDGNIIEVSGGKLYASENRTWVSYDEIPKNLINAFIAIEDKRFEEHNGVDWKMTIRAFVYYAIGQSDRGGSTITQQLIKNVTGDDERTIQRKVEEIFRALNLEKVMSKDEILELYLNTVYFSSGAYGVQSAARTYFNKNVSDLTLIECAALAGIVQNPYKWDPRLHPENNTERRNDILWEMLEQGKITQVEYDEAVYGGDLVIYSPSEDDDEESDAPVDTGNVTSWYVDAVIEDAVELFMKEYNVSETAALRMVYSGGYRIYVAMDLDVQEAMESVYEDDAYFNKIVSATDSIMQPQSAMVIVHPQNGTILGLVGGRGKKAQSRLLSYATQTTRQPGSAIKPLATYSLALEKKIIHYSTVFDDSPFEMNASTGSTGATVYTPWPTNASGRYGGLTALNDGITRSINTIAVRVLNKLGTQNSYDFLTKKLGFTTIYDKKIVNDKVATDIGLAQLGIGGLTFGVTVEELTSAYTMVTNDGVYVSPRTILEIRDSNNNLVIDNQPTENIAISVENAAIMRKMLQNVTNLSSGTGSGTEMAKIMDTGGKTGTTNKNYDKWFIGFTPYYLGGVWFGYETQQTLSGFSGNPAVDIWDAVMLRVHAKIIDRVRAGEAQFMTFTLPDTVVEIKYCKDSGLIATEACELDPRGNRTETGYYTTDNCPTAFCDTHIVVNYCIEGKGVASEYCPPEGCRKVALIAEYSRDYPADVSIGDAQYVYRDLTVGNVVYRGKDGAFFLNELESGHYCGKSPAVSNPYNCYCQKHYSGQPYGLVLFPETEEPSETAALPPDDKRIRADNRGS